MVKQVIGASPDASGEELDSIGGEIASLFLKSSWDGKHSKGIYGKCHLPQVVAINISTGEKISK